MSDFEENQNDKSDNEVSDITDNTKLMPSSKLPSSFITFWNSSNT